MERLVAQRIRNERMLRSMFEHVGFRRNSPDFLGLGIYSRMKFDITTMQQAAAHWSRPYGTGLELIFYTRPPTFP